MQDVDCDRSLAKALLSRGIGLLTALVGAVSLMAVAAAAASSTAPPAPGNDDMASAQIIRSLPASLSGTVVGAMLEPNEVSSACATQPTVNSVWYSLKSSSAQRIAINLAAAGKLEATVDVYHLQRSQPQGA